MSALPWDDPEHDVVGDLARAADAAARGAQWLTGGLRSSPCSTCWFAGGEPDATHCGRCPCCPSVEQSREQSRHARTAEGR